MSNQGNLAIDKYLAACLQIEELAGEIYGYWSQSPLYDQGLCGLWRAMELEEREHARQIEPLRYTLRDDATEIPAVAELFAQQMAEYARSCKLRIRELRMPPPAAVFLAIRMEERFARFHTSQAVLFPSGKTRQLFTNLAHEDGSHAGLLQQIHYEIYQADARLLAACH